MKAKHAFWVIVAVAVPVVLGAEAYYFHSESSMRERRLTGRLLVDRSMLSVHFQAMAREDNERDQRFQEFVRSLTEKMASQKCTARFISPDESILKEQPADEFERELLGRFGDAAAKEIASRERPLLFAERLTADQAEYSYYQPVFADKGCLNVCHEPHIVIDLGSNGEPSVFGRAAPGNQKWKEGDLMAVVEIKIPVGPTRRVVR